MGKAMSDERLAEIHGFLADDEHEYVRYQRPIVVELVAEVDRLRRLSAELETLRAQRDWQPGRWRQVRRPDGSLWMETSDGEEAEAEARKQGWPLYRLWECRETEWRPEPTGAAP